MSNDDTLREHLLYLLGGGGAHLDFEKAVAELPVSLRGVTPPGAPHTAWQLLEHLRIAQRDILEFSRDPAYVSPPWPEGYWPAAKAPASQEEWEASLAGFRADRQAIRELVADPESDLWTPLPHGDGQTLLREALLVADHNAYHLGQLVLLRQTLDAWPPQPAADP
jgi:hypothetical protein